MNPLSDYSKTGRERGEGKEGGRKGEREGGRKEEREREGGGREVE